MSRRRGHDRHLLLSCACSFGQALQQHVTKLQADADALKAAHAKKDDDMGRLVDGVTSQLAAAREGVRAKQDLIQSSEASMERLRSRRALKAHLYISASPFLLLCGMLACLPCLILRG